MPKRVNVILSDEQHQELVQTRDHHEKAYMREKAAALLKMSDEHLPATEIAEHRLLKRRDDNTVRAWVGRYLKDGLAGLLVHTGRGRKPVFSPSASNPASRRPGGARSLAPRSHTLRA